MLRKIYGIEESSVCIARWDMLFVLLVCKMEEGVVRRDVVWWKRRRSRIDRLDRSSEMMYIMGTKGELQWAVNTVFGFNKRTEHARS